MVDFIEALSSDQAATGDEIDQADAPLTTRRRKGGLPMAIADKPTELSEHVLDAVKKGQQGALDAVRTFADRIDQALPLHGEGPSKRQEVIDAALSMADRLIQTQYDFLSTVIRSAGNSLGASQPASQPEQKVEEKAQKEAKE